MHEGMTNAQLYIAIGVPIGFNTLCLTLAVAYINQRLNDLRDLWRAELRRVEEVLDARLKHLEDAR